MKPPVKAAKTSGAKRPAKGSVPPRFIPPMQCLPFATLPDGGQWHYEIKFDGYRCEAVKRGSHVELFSRNEKKLTARFPDVASAIAALLGNLVIDGEIVALDEQGRPSFQLLQNSRSRPAAVIFYAFDLLHRDGQDLQALPIERRRAALEKVMAKAVEPVRLSPLLEGEPEGILAAVRSLGLEGVVSKRHGSPYEAGERPGHWIKFRTDRAQEFVIGGYVPNGQSFDALLVGVYEKKRLQYVAKIRNGFVPRTRAAIMPALKRLATPRCPFVNLPEETGSQWREPLTAEKMKECRWVKPALVCQVKFLEWTESAHLRHCSFVAMREDKDAAAVVRET